ncbi:MAG TPA: hypothetical protein DCX22_02930, partial [Dehalococcoidia bacterium]|nr:hypothetical protein [Dehalococcoidia bacterium]
MEVAMQWLRKAVRWEYFGLLLLVLITLGMHFSVINRPDVLMFDEQHYVVDARSIIAGNESSRLEHPPLAKLMIMAGMLLFGDNPFGWRFFSVLFGTFIIILFYLICRRLLMSKRESFLATFLLAFENLTFVQAGIAMLDVYCLAFMMLCFWLYLRGNYLLSSVAVALAAVAKLTGVFALAAIGLHWLLTRRDRTYRVIGAFWLSAGSFVLLYWLFSYPVTHRLINPVDGMQNMVEQLASVTYAVSNHPSKSYPWEWVLLPLIMPYWYTPHYLGAISFTIWALILPSVGYMGWMAWKNRRRTISVFVLSWFLCAYLLFIPLCLVSNRVMYVYYFYPTIGAICIALGLGLSYLWNLCQTGYGKVRNLAPWIVGFYLLCHIV